jgi:predicted  nucleic acid-binding Zn-ribbon protein
MLRVYIIVGIVALLSSFGYSGYRYVVNMQQQVVTLTTNNALLDSAVKTQQDTIDQAQKNATRQAELNQQLTGRLQAAESNLDALRKRFTEIDINKQAIEDPAGLEVRINNAVNRLISDIQSETTAQPSGIDPSSE